MSQYYKPNRKPDWNYGGAKWRLSRSKIELFTECERCFFIDNKLGTGRPRGPAFTINVAVDALLKKEVDTHRIGKTAHPLMKQYGINAVPFNHEKIDVWRENFKGIEYVHPPTGFTISGAVDDIWVTPKGELIVVDYKATSKDGSIETLSDSSWEPQYKRQIGIYQWLLRQLGFKVSNRGYFVYANAGTDAEAFDGKLEFEVTVVPCDGDSEWVDEVLPRIKKCLEGDTLPVANPDCDFCRYREAAGKALLPFAAKSPTPKPTGKKIAKAKNDEEKTSKLF